MVLNESPSSNTCIRIIIIIMNITIIHIHSRRAIQLFLFFLGNIYYYLIHQNIFLYTKFNSNLFLVILCTQYIKLTSTSIIFETTKRILIKFVTCVQFLQCNQHSYLVLIMYIPTYMFRLYIWVIFTWYPHLNINNPNYHATHYNRTL
jgi:hypothetical protein